jgi:hypothetical protein
VGHAEHRLLVRRAGGASTARREVARPSPRAPGRPAPGLSVDGLVVPGLLLLVARDLQLHDPPRVLAWRILHDERLAAVAGWLEPLLPRPPAGFDRDPIALLLGAFAIALAIAYLATALRSGSVRLRAVLLGVAATVLVVAPTAGFMAMGAVTGRPYGQDGGVVQLPLALARILDGQSPYAADYSDSILGKQARVSDFWDAHGGNPILRHHAYLPGTHLVMLPFHVVSRRLLGWFDPRAVTLLAWAAAALLAARVVGGGARGLAAAAAVLVSPLVYWQQVFGANDLLPAALLLVAVQLGRRGRIMAAGAVVGLACATKQLAWPFAPFLLVALSGATRWADLAGRRFLTPLAAAALVFAAVVLPVAALDLSAFWADVVVYNAGLGGADNYPLGGTPGFGVANFIIYAGGVSSLRDHVPLGIFYVLLVPLGLWLLRTQLRAGGLGFALLCGSAALVATLYVSRVAHPNYLMLAAVLAPVGLLLDGRRPADVVVAPLLLLALAVEMAEPELLRATWEQAATFGLPRRATGLVAALLPRAGPELTADPLGLVMSALLAGLATVSLWAGVLGAGQCVRRMLVGMGLVVGVVLPTLTVMGLGRASGAVRAQDAWMAAASARAPVIEAWSASFRRDPPAAILPQPRSAPASPVIRRLLSATGGADPRVLLLLALGGCAALFSMLAPPALQPLALATGLLSPAVAGGVAFGSPAILGLSGILTAGLLAARSGWLSGAILGITALIVPPALLGAPVVLASGVEPRRWIGLAIGLLAWMPSVAVEPGLGLANLFLYRDTAGGPAGVLLAVLRVAALIVTIVVSARSRVNPWALAALCVTVGLFLTPGVSGHDVAIPLGLIAVAAVTSRKDEGGEGGHAPVTPAHPSQNG